MTDFYTRMKNTLHDKTELLNTVNNIYPENEQPQPPYAIIDYSVLNLSNVSQYDLSYSSDGINTRVGPNSIDSGFKSNIFGSDILVDRIAIPPYILAEDAFGYRALQTHFSESIKAQFPSINEGGYWQPAYIAGNIAIGGNSSQRLKGGLCLYNPVTSTYSVNSSLPMGNLSIGYNSLLSEDSGCLTTAIGTNAALSQKSGQNSLINEIVSTASGTFTIPTLQKQECFKNSNVSIGHSSLLYNVSGKTNVVVANQGLYNARFAENSIAVGHNSLTNILKSLNNIAYGFESLKFLSDGSSNIVCGVNISGFNGTFSKGSNNIFLGNNLISNYNGGNNNILIGSNNTPLNSALSVYSNMSGDYNIVIGCNSLRSEGTIKGQKSNNLIVGNNTFAGSNAKNNINFNTVVGNNSLNVICTNPNLSVIYNTIIGGNLLNSWNVDNSTVQKSNGLTVLGNIDYIDTNTNLIECTFAGKLPQLLNNNENISVLGSIRENRFFLNIKNSTCIGRNVTYNYTPGSGTDKNAILLGNSTITSLRCAVTSITTLSDIRDKTEIHDMTAGLSFILKLDPVKYKLNMREWYDDGDNSDKSKKSEKYQTGLIAQTVESICNSTEFQNVNLDLLDGSDNHKCLKYQNLIFPLINSIKELDFDLQNINNTILELEKQLTSK